MTTNSHDLPLFTTESPSAAIDFLSTLPGEYEALIEIWVNGILVWRNEAAAATLIEGLKA